MISHTMYSDLFISFLLVVIDVYNVVYGRPASRHTLQDDSWMRPGTGSRQDNR